MTMKKVLFCLLCLYSILFSVQAQVTHTLRGHSDAINSVAFHPAGDILASGSADHTIKIWDVKTHQLLHSIQAHTGPVKDLSFNKDGTILASASADYTVKLWKVDGYQLIKTLSKHTGVVSVVDFHPNGKTLISGSHDNTLMIWSVKDYRMLQKISDHTDAIICLAINSDGSYFASGSSDKNIKIWNTEDEGLSYTFETRIPYGGIVKSLAFHPKEDFLVSAGTDNTLKIWDILARRMEKKIDLQSTVVTMDFDAKGEMLITGDANQTTLRWLFSQEEPVYKVDSETAALSVKSNPKGGSIAIGYDGFNENDYVIQLINIDDYYLALFPRQEIDFDFYLSKKEKVAEDMLRLSSLTLPKDPFETTQQYNQRLASYRDSLFKLKDKYIYLFEHQKKVDKLTRECSIKNSLREINITQSAVFDPNNYNADMGTWEVEIDGLAHTINIVAEEARSLYSNKTNLRVLAAEQTFADGSKKLFNIKIIHPSIEGKEYIVGEHRAALYADVDCSSIK